ncbi:MAG: hypothetical protein J5588_05315 [Bacteroidales bacterium]|nr:hypothetical protein [Bacteroidales bacterium]
MPKAKRKTTTKKKKSGTKKIKRKVKSVTTFVCGVLLSCVVIFFGWKFLQNTDDDDEEIIVGETPKVCLRVEENYGKAIDSCAKIFNLNSRYIKSLACLECSGRTDRPNRFERHVYKRLKNVRDGKLTDYEGVTQKMLHDASDDALKNLATSWGPFQIMGYKCLHLNINVADLRGNDGVYWGVKWINMEYGHLLKKGRYRDAFHYHNTGRVYPANGKPTTYDPNYVSNGLEYMKYF